MTDNFKLNLHQIIDEYTRTTDAAFKYQQKMLDKQYNALIEIVKTLNSIDLGIEEFATVKPAKKAAPVQAKKEVKTPAAKPVVKASIRAAVAEKTETTKPVVKAEIRAAVAKENSTKPAAKPVAKKTTAKPVAKKAAAKPAAKKTASKATSKDRLAALKQATQEAVKQAK